MMAKKEGVRLDFLGEVELWEKTAIAALTGILASQPFDDPHDVGQAVAIATSCADVFVTEWKKRWS